MAGDDPQDETRGLEIVWLSVLILCLFVCSDLRYLCVLICDLMF